MLKFIGRIKGAWAVLTGKAFAIPYTLYKQKRVYFRDQDVVRQEMRYDSVDAVAYMMESFKNKEKNNA